MKSPSERYEDLKLKKISLIERINLLLMIKDTPTSRLDELTSELRETNLLLMQAQTERIN